MRCSRYLDAVVACSRWGVAQRLADKWASRRWERLLNSLAREVGPHLPLLTKAGYGPYRWVVDQAEVSTDVFSRSRGALQAVLPALRRPYHGHRQQPFRALSRQ